MWLFQFIILFILSTLYRLLLYIQIELVELTFASFSVSMALLHFAISIFQGETVRSFPCHLFISPKHSHRVIHFIYYFPRQIYPTFSNNSLFTSLNTPSKTYSIMSTTVLLNSTEALMSHSSTAPQISLCFYLCLYYYFNFIQCIKSYFI